MVPQDSENAERSKERLIDMAWLLNDLTSDLKTPVDLLVQLQPQMEASKQNFQSLSRLCIASLIVNLCKFDEIIVHYGAEINGFPDAIKAPLREVKIEIEKRGMYAFRSKYLAHAFSDVKGQPKKPLSFDDNVKSMMRVIDYNLNPVTENVYRFGAWVYTQSDETSVVHVIYNAVKYIESTVGGLGERR
ncbi:hypothetical protein PSH77_16565 [Pseudomonas extremorientalis]|jgi:hypothetical protein|uniref:hypothetical protein n=1 Tax=Pseudomonas extremorientalis TaxID=169669 RepID=UPI002735A375|nr:hypothetical protein [Pseudomonas extremorientalis]WLG54299.1 hypothetical protein PSH77_16565 [Pseudomonas extremorientalis]